MRDLTYGLYGLDRAIARSAMRLMALRPSENTANCWALVDAYGELSIWNNDRHMPTQAEAENYRIRLGLSVNQYPVYQLTRPCHVVRCDVCGLPADPEGNDEPAHYSSVDAGVRVALGIGWARTGRGLVCGNCH